ncbi:DUF2846 domain-containing protein [Pseudidiomarina sp. 1APR75-33.1]|uniref:DUF2846 domain-containing protein n=1 Tax=Pseudidiomarina terrestris TaxID=2820060 RepID=UPI00264EAA91|nr:DUF2846 domain-containing protein [Pseudidiomarina sp. 1APR75-33.1]MDN7126921.1 DUF2846 domain-containing protein [Pseudidiomarina sp. 1APR75-33.1]
MNFKFLSALGIVALTLSGCASVPLESAENSAAAKAFDAPTGNNAGLYIYRDSSFGGALKKSVWLDEKCVGETAPNIFFHLDVEGDRQHTLSTESEFSPNDLVLETESGKNYFVRQYIKMGVFVGGANLEVVDPEVAKKAIADLDLAKPGTCG